MHWNCQLLVVWVVLQFSVRNTVQCFKTEQQFDIQFGVSDTNQTLWSTVINVWYRSCTYMFEIIEKHAYLFQPWYYTVIVKKVTARQLTNILLKAVVLFAHRTLWTSTCTNTKMTLQHYFVCCVCLGNMYCDYVLLSCWRENAIIELIYRVRICDHLGVFGSIYGASTKDNTDSKLLFCFDWSL